MLKTPEKLKGSIRRVFHGIKVSLLGYSLAI